ncbi:MAG: ATP-binding protein, partial [Chloroflexi bacterium]|nr:ATP-binding protein [Chloroflexota bacterium]
LLAAVAFAVMGAVFASHGLVTPGALINHAHPAIEWSAWLTLFSGGFLFALASLDRPDRPSTRLPVRRIIFATVGATILYLAVAAFAPGWLDQLGAQVDPWHKQIIAFLTFILWVFATWRLWQSWRMTHARVDGVLAFVALWLAQATISMHGFPIWQLSWWLYHFVLLASFLASVYVLVSEYEQARQFRLLPYYTAASLIFTSFLALLASDLFARFAYQTAASQIESDAADQISNLSQAITGALPAEATAADIRDIVTTQLVSLPIGNVVVYDDRGKVLYPNDPQYPTIVPDDVRPAYGQALDGVQTVQIRSPDEPPIGYKPGQNVHLVLTFVPFSGRKVDGPPMGVIETIREAPELTGAILRSRNAGLGITALTMTGLFMALLLVVHRANGIINSRTTELSQAYSNLRRAEAMRDDLTHMIVHDLRNPLSSISASLDLLNMAGDRVGPETRHQYLDIARSGIRRLAGLIDNILTVSKLESGNFQLRRKPVQLNQLLQERLQEFAPRAAAEKKQLLLECSPEWVASLDAELIGRVVDNLLGNAFKYTSTGEGKIEVFVHSQDRRYIFHVRDNGEGIADEHKQKIFEKYGQAPNQHAEHKGTGLGLTFCRMVVEAHGGEIIVQDAPGGGSDFVFWLPQTPQ